LNAFRYLDFKRIEDVNDVTLNEYQLLMKAYALKQVDKQYEMHMQAWVNQQAKATKQKGKKTVPYFKDFKQFFDYEAQVEQIMGKRIVKKLDRRKQILLKANS